MHANGVTLLVYTTTNNNFRNAWRLGLLLFRKNRTREIYRDFSDIQVSKQVKECKTVIHESIHHQFIIHPGHVQTSGPLTIMTFSVIELFFNLT